MRVEFSGSVTSDMLRSITRGLDADPVVAGRLLVFSGPWPGKGSAPTGANSILVLFPFNRPSLASVLGNTLALSYTGTVLAQGSGEAVWARCVDGAGNFVVDLDVSLPGGGGAVELTIEGGSLTVYAGGIVSMALAGFALP